MNIHILGICGTFMGSLAVIARQLGHEVSGSDAEVYPPMSEQLKTQGIELKQGYRPENLQGADVVIIGNALSRGNPAVEYILAQDLPFMSGPQWIAAQLAKRHVMAVAGTHGKTTTSTILSWILTDNGINTGFLIGGIPQNFGVSAKCGAAPYFVIEADEYDTAFFDKRSKFIHYRPRTLIINNIEFDHADIFADLNAIERQFHHLVRTVPGNGRIIHPQNQPAIERVMAMGCWTPTTRFDGDAAWTIGWHTPDYHEFDVLCQGEVVARVHWPMLGRHNALNALAAVIAAAEAGVSGQAAARSLSRFQGVKRRLQVRAKVNGVTLYDDFAHHPTAIRATIDALRSHIGKQRLIAVLEPRSNTMRLGVHNATLGPALAAADLVAVLQPPDIDWDVAALSHVLGERCRVHKHLDALLFDLLGCSRPGDHLLVMSNGSFGGLHEKLISGLERKYPGG